MSTRTIWISPTDWVSGDPTLAINYPSTEHPAVEITATTPGDFKWVFVGLRLPPCAEIKAVRICYQLSDSASFISQVRLTEMKTPERALIRHDDPTNLTSTDPACYVSELARPYRPEGAVMLQLRLNFADSSDKITLGGVGIEQQRYGTSVISCDIRFSLQGRYASMLDLSGFGVTNNVVTLHGAALKGAGEITIEEFATTDRAEIREQLRNYLEFRNQIMGRIECENNHLVVLDFEPADPTEPHPADPSRARPFHLTHLGSFEDDPPRQERIIQGYINRVEVVRELMPKVKLGLHKVVVPEGKGGITERFLQRMRGYERAGELGLYDQLDYLVPVLYTRFGPNDVTDRTDLDTVHSWIEASTRQGIKSSSTLTRTNGKPIPLAPYLSFWAFNSNSEHHRQAVLPETIHRQLRILQEYCPVEIIVLWSGWETMEEMRTHGRPVEPIGLRNFLTQVAELSPPGRAIAPFIPGGA